jgi:hypothetical protein
MASESETQLLLTNLKWHRELVAEMESRLDNLRHQGARLSSAELDQSIATIEEMCEIAVRRTEEIQVQVDTQGM